MGVENKMGDMCGIPSLNGQFIKDSNLTSVCSVNGYYNYALVMTAIGSAYSAAMSTKTFLWCMSKSHYLCDYGKPYLQLHINAELTHQCWIETHAVVACRDHHAAISLAIGMLATSAHHVQDRHTTPCRWCCC